MKRQKTQNISDDKLSSIEQKIELIDQKIGDMESRLEFKILANAAETRQHLVRNLESIIGLQIKHLSQDLESKISKFTNLIQTAIDPLLKELETREQDRAIHSHQHEGVDKRLRSHEKRIQKLETV